MVIDLLLRVVASRSDEFWTVTTPGSDEDDDDEKTGVGYGFEYEDVGSCSTGGSEEEDTKSSFVKGGG